MTPVKMNPNHQQHMGTCSPVSTQVQRVYPSTTCLPEYNTSTQVQLLYPSRTAAQTQNKNPVVSFKEGSSLDEPRTDLKLCPMLKPNTSSFFCSFFLLVLQIKGQIYSRWCFPKFWSAQPCLPPSLSINEWQEGLLLLASPAKWQLEVLHSTKPECPISSIFLPSFVDLGGLGNSGKTMSSCWISRLRRLTCHNHLR